MKTSILFCAGILCGTMESGLIPNAHAGSEAHGGEVTIVDGVPVLRDTVDDTVITCRYGADVKTANPAWRELISSLDNVNFYIGRIYDHKIDDLYFCFGKARLLEFSTEDQGMLFESYGERNTVQKVAVRRSVDGRMGNIVLVNESLYSGMSLRHQAEVLFHEVTHDFLPLNDPERNAHLRSFVNAVITNRDQPLAPSAFALQIQLFGLELPNNYRTLQAHQTEMQIAFDVNRPVLERTTAALAAREVMPYLDARDSAIFNKLVDVDAFFANAVLNGDVELATRLLALGASPNTAIQGISPIRAAVAQNNRNLFSLLAQNPDTLIEPSLVDHLIRGNHDMYLDILLDANRFGFQDALNPLRVAIAVKNRAAVDRLARDPRMYANFRFNDIMDLLIPELSGSEQRLLRDTAFAEFVGLNATAPYFKLDWIVSYAINKAYTGSLVRCLELDPGMARGAVGSALMTVAIQESAAQLLRTAITAGADMKARDAFGSTYLHLAVPQRNPEIIRILLEAGVDPSLKNGAGKTALALAKRMHDKRLISELRAAKSQ